ncbi:hypothetical protein OAS19_05885 [Altererythrobacter sp.]|nr:hypothetical protein [Altererythrobacter sp.]
MLTSFLDGRTLPEDFARAIKQEVDACEEGFRSPANVGYIIISDGPQLIVTQEHMKRLLGSMLDETLPWMSANYAGDCLIMSDDFEPEDNDVAEAIEFVADDSRPPTADEIREAIKALN